MKTRCVFLLYIIIICKGRQGCVKGKRGRVLLFTLFAREREDVQESEDVAVQESCRKARGTEVRM